MFPENERITGIRGIGEKKAQAFMKLGVTTLCDLISFYPRRYEDRSVFKMLRLIEDGESVSVRVTVADEPRLNRVRKGMELVKFRVFDESGMADVTYFNQSYMKNNLSRGDEINIYGRFEVNGSRISVINPLYEKAGSKNSFTGKIVPVYSLTAGLNNRTVSDAVRACLDKYGTLVEDLLPPELSTQYSFISEYDALRAVHFPESFEQLAAARRRLVYEELFVFSLAMGMLRGSGEARPGIMINSSADAFLSSLPFSPTGAQRRAIAQCLQDMSSGRAMSRLVQGDVGSGKTLVAAAAIYCVREAGYTSAFMAPTEILARQHYNTLSGMLGPFGFRISLLTGSTAQKERRDILRQLASGETDLVVGTHALFSDDVEYSRLALVITDEQHRFGVRQRGALIEKGSNTHVLVMSATPIPRTLALIIYGDLDVSVIDEMPPGRQTVDTFAVDSRYRQRLNAFILKQVQEGGQVFVVCPKVEDGDDGPTDLKSAAEYTEELKAALPQLRFGCVHGRLPAAEKNAVMERFAEGSIDVLVATTVIEVGVDVPNANLMIIENAERFGLSQLHQLRGRVGRGKRKSYCVLVSDSKTETARERLSVLTKSADGFKIAEEDLRLRGPGDFFGSKQHGLPEMQIANLGADMEILQSAHDDAFALLESDPELTLPEHSGLKRQIDRFYSRSENSFN